MSDTNDQLALISGASATGKSVSLRNIRDQPDWMYFNCEGKRLPFKNSFNAFRISDPYQVHEGFDAAIDGKINAKGIITDTTTFMMDMLETLYVNGAPNTQQAWGDFAQFWRTLMMDKVVNFGKPVLMLAHTLTTLNESLGEYQTAVPVKGSLKNQGIEAYFSTVVSTKKVTLKELEPYHNNLLNISEEDELLGYKHVFQTRLTKATKNERIRSPMGMFTKEQTYIDNDAQLLLDHLDSYYGV